MLETRDAPDLTYLCKLLHETLQLPVFCRTDADIPEESFWNAGLPAHPIYADPYELYRSISNKGSESTRPLLYDSDYLEQFAIVPVICNGTRTAMIVIGPVTHQKRNDDWYAQLLDESANQDQAGWLAYWHSLPIMNRLRFLHVCVTAHWMLNREALDVTDIILQTSSDLESKAPRPEQEHVLKIADRREFTLLHEETESTSQMLDSIRRGNSIELMKQLAQATYVSGSIDEPSPRSYLRKVKNLAIGGITMASRAATEGGLQEELAATLCELHVQRIESLHDLTKVSTAVIGAIVDFADRVDQCRRNRVSKAVRLSMDYIYLHLFEDISIDQFSSVSGLNPHYLSQRFKQETGLTLMNYIQRERIEEAKKLLDHSNDSISSIGARLTFYDQTHFLKVFKKHTGLTPKQYRNRKGP